MLTSTQLSAPRQTPPPHTPGQNRTSPAHADSARIGPARADSVHTDSVHAGPGQACAARTGPARAGSAPVDPAPVDPVLVDPVLVDPVPVGLTHAGLTHVGPTHAGPTQVGPAHGDRVCANPTHGDRAASGSASGPGSGDRSGAVGSCRVDPARSRALARADRVLARDRTFVSERGPRSPVWLLSASSATVLAEPEPATLVDGSGGDVGITGDAELTVPPSRLVHGGTVREVVSWAGPWPAGERWWDEQAVVLAAHLQVVGVAADGGQLAFLLIRTGGKWAVEGVYG